MSYSWWVNKHKHFFNRLLLTDIHDGSPWELTWMSLECWENPGWQIYVIKITTKLKFASDSETFKIHFDILIRRIYYLLCYNRKCCAGRKGKHEKEFTMAGSILSTYGNVLKQTFICNKKVPIFILHMKGIVVSCNKKQDICHNNNNVTIFLTMFSGTKPAVCCQY